MTTETHSTSLERSQYLYHTQFQFRVLAGVHPGKCDGKNKHTPPSMNGPLDYRLKKKKKYSHNSISLHNMVKWIDTLEKSFKKIINILLQLFGTLKYPNVIRG